MIYKIFFVGLFFLAITNFGGMSDVWNDRDGIPTHRKTGHSPEWTDLNGSDPGVNTAATHTNDRSVVERE